MQNVVYTYLMQLSGCLGTTTTYVDISLRTYFPSTGLGRSSGPRVTSSILECGCKLHHRSRDKEVFFFFLQKRVRLHDDMYITTQLLRIINETFISLADAVAPKKKKNFMSKMKPKRIIIIHEFPSLPTSIPTTPYPVYGAGPGIL